MGFETERKFLLASNWDIYFSLAEQKNTLHIQQAYLTSDPARTVRVRVVKTQIKEDPSILKQRAFITVKGSKTGMTAPEFEYEVPVDDGKSLLHMCITGSLIEKTRYVIPVDDSPLVWEIDEFHGRHAGLVLAEIELPTESTSIPQHPLAIIREVTYDHRYSNLHLALTPIRDWDNSHPMYIGG